MVKVIKNNGEDYKYIDSMFDLCNIKYGENLKKTDLFQYAYKIAADFTLRVIEIL